jgi:hypothetical protein
MGSDHCALGNLHALTVERQHLELATVMALNPPLTPPAAQGEDSALSPCRAVRRGEPEGGRLHPHQTPSDERDTTWTVSGCGNDYISRV